HLPPFGSGRDLRGGPRTGARRTPRTAPGERVRSDSSAQPSDNSRGRPARGRPLSDQPLSDHQQQLRLMEALPLAAPEPLGPDDLARHVGPHADIATLLRELAETYAGRGVNLVRVACGWTFRTAP